MKSRFDFGDDKQYKEYLKSYYVGQVICGASLQTTKRDVSFVISIVDELIKQLHTDEKK